MDRARAAGRAWRRRDVALVVAVVAAALAVRLPFLPYRSDDFNLWVSVWYDFIVANGYFRSWQYDFSNYNPPYLYLLTAAAYFVPSAPKLLAVKGVSILGDFLLAWFSYRCVRLRYPGSRTIPVLASGAVLLAPTVVLNSARWAQVDAIYTALLMACLYGLLSGRHARAFAAFGLAFAFKAQAAFFAPLLYWFSTKKKVSGRCLWPVPAAFLAALAPAVLAGRPLFDLFSIYFEQAEQHSLLVTTAPNPYMWISNDHYRWWPAGVLVTLALVHGVRRLLERRRIEMTRETVALLALFSVLLAPYFLPKMMGRFFYPADVFAIVLAFYLPRLWYVPVAVGAASLTPYAVYLFGYDDAPVRWAAALLLAVLADLTRRLFREAGARFDFGAARRWLGRRARAGTAAAAPLLTLLLALAALVAAFSGERRLDRPLANDGASAETLARAVGRSFETGSRVRTPSDDPAPLFGAADRPGGPGLRATRPALDAEGRIVREIVPGGSAAFDHLLAALLRHFDDDLSARVAAARALMLAFFCGAALFAWLSLCRALAFRRPGRRGSARWLALAATLLGFGSAAAAGADTVAVSGSPEVFGVFLVFHGMVVFLGEGRFGQLLGKSGAALLLGLGAAALLAPFVVLGLAGEWWRRRAAVREGENGAGSGADSFLRPFPAVSVRGPIASPYLALGAFCAIFAAGSVAAGGVGGPSGRPAGPVEAGGAAESAAFGGSVAEGLRRVGPGFIPAGALPGGLSAAGAVSEGRDWPWAGAGALLAAAGLAGAALLRSFPLLALALSGLVSALWLGRGAPPEAAALAALGLPLTAWTAGFAALRGRRAYAAAGAAVAVWGLSFGGAVSTGWPVVLRGGDRDSSPGASEARAANDRLREDFRRIGRVLRYRAERTVFLPPLEVGGRALSGARARFFLPEAVVTDDPARRALAEFTIEAPGTAAGLLTAGNGVAFLHHRAARDGELDGMIEATGPPVARSEFEVHLGGGRLLFVKNDCRPEHLEGTLIVHLTPEVPDDLPPHRKPYGFENLSFPFGQGAFERGARCVAGVRFPEYPIRRAVVGRAFRNLDASYDAVWRAEFVPAGAAGATGPAASAPDDRLPAAPAGKQP